MSADTLLVLHSYSFRHYPLEHVFAVARDQGWAAVELSGWHVAAEGVEEELAAAVALGERHGIRVHCAPYGGNFATEDACARERSLELTRRAIDACARHDIGLVNGWAGWMSTDWSDWRRSGSALAAPAHYERAAAAYRELGAYAAERGVRVAIEVHPNTLHDCMSGLARLLEAVPERSVVATWDAANAYVVSEADRDPEVLAQLGDRLGYFHAKNCLLLREGVADFNVDTAAGVVDNYRWLAALGGLAAPPAVCVEYCGEGDPHPPLAAAQGYVRRCLEIAKG